MKPTLYLRIAAVLTLIHGILHTVGGVFGTPPEHSVQAAVIAIMKASTFPAMGATRSFWDFNLGYGLFASVSLLVLGALLWQIAPLARTHSPQIRPLLVTLLLNFIVWSVVTERYFFLAPAVMEIVIAVFIALAFVTPAREFLLTSRRP